jgi:hypothetical protein
MQLGSFGSHHVHVELQGPLHDTGGHDTGAAAQAPSALQALLPGGSTHDGSAGSHSMHASPHPFVAHGLNGGEQSTGA